MSEMKKDLQEHYTEEAKKHADFLCEKVFKPAFMMAFIHGAKHGREDVLKEHKTASGDCGYLRPFPNTLSESDLFYKFEEAWKEFCKKQPTWPSEYQKEIAEAFWRLGYEVHNT